MVCNFLWWCRLGVILCLAFSDIFSLTGANYVFIRSDTFSVTALFSWSYKWIHKIFLLPIIKLTFEIRYCNWPLAINVLNTNKSHHKKKTKKLVFSSLHTQYSNHFLPVFVERPHIFKPVTCYHITSTHLHCIWLV